MSQEITIKHMIPMRVKQDIAYRMALDPKRRVAWDKNITSASYEGEAKLANNALVNIKLPRRLLGIKYQAKCTNLQAPLRGSWESLGGVGPLESLTQSWSFRNVQSGTEVTFSIKATVRYGWIKSQAERILNNIAVSTLLELQRKVDAAGAQLLEELSKEMAEKQRAEKQSAKNKK